MNLNELALAIHKENKSKGWWTDLETGEDITKTRNRIELFALVITEIIEAKKAGLFELRDDKIPEYWGCEAEAVDAQIRILDVVGADGTDIISYIEKSQMNAVERLEDISWEAQLLEIVETMTDAIEAARKQRDYNPYLADCLILINELGRMYQLDLEGAMSTKRAFNQVREDHTLEHRKGADGKKS